MTRLRSLFALAPLGMASLAVAQTPVPPVAGDIAISEIMNNPAPDACVTDNNGEWFEITNISIKTLDMNGIFIQDGITPGATFFRTTSTVATLAPLYPGQKLLFCRTNDANVNGGLTNVDYFYTSSPANADNSTVGTTSMNLNNGQDGLHVTVGGPFTVPAVNPNNYVAGTLIESVGYNSSVTPYTSSGAGQAGERIDLFQPMVTSGTANSANLAISTALQNASGVGCVNNTYLGTPRATNSVDTTNWPTNVPYDSGTYPNSGSLKFTLPLSVGAGSATFTVNGGAGLASLPYYLGYSEDIPGEYPIELFIPGNPGSIVIDLVTSAYLSGYAFDGTGAGSASVAIPANPILVGLKFQLQWLAVDGVTPIVLSNGVRATITE
jgi:hypothetical protein